MNANVKVMKNGKIVEFYKAEIVKVKTDNFLLLNLEFSDNKPLYIYVGINHNISKITNFISDCVKKNIEMDLELLVIDLKCGVDELPYFMSVKKTNRVLDYIKGVLWKRD